MNKADLINEVANVVSTKTEAQAAVDCVFQSIVDTLKKGDVATLVGFGTFKVVKRKARLGRNPQTGAEIQISASNAPKFVPGKALKDTVNEID
jgi:DNA-binding protein HU-beta